LYANHYLCDMFYTLTEMFVYKFLLGFYKIWDIVVLFREIGVRNKENVRNFHKIVANEIFCGIIIAMSRFYHNKIRKNFYVAAL